MLTGKFTAIRTILFSVVAVLATIPGARASLPLSVPGDGSVAAAVADQTEAEIAAGEGVLLAVWSDERANVTAFNEGETSADIYGMRLSSSGDFLDAVPLAITAAPAAQNKPRAAWNGSHWLVVYESYDTSGTGFFYSQSIEAVRVSPTGEVLDAQAIRFPGIPSGSWTVTANGSGWTITARRSSASSDIVALRVSADGVLLDAPTHTVVDSSIYQASNFRLAYADGVHLLTFDNYVSLGTYHTIGVRFDDNLNLLDTAPLELVDSSTAGLVSNGSAFYLVWNEFQPDLSTLLLGSRLDTLATLLDPGGVTVAGDKGVSSTTVSALWDGINWRVVFQIGTDLWTTRVSESGSVLDPGGVPVPGPQSGRTAGDGAGGFQIVWSDFADNNYDTYTAAVDASNVASADQFLSIGTGQQLRSDAALGDDGMMLVYRSLRAASTRVLAQPLHANGLPLTAVPIELESGPGFIGPGSPAVAWNGSVYLVAWATAEGVAAQRIAQDGTLLDGNPITVMPNAFGRADVAALGNDFLVTGRQFGSSSEFVLPVAARVSGSGTVLDAAPQVLGAYYAGTPAVTSIGGRWLVVWHRNFSHDDPTAETLGTFISADGTLEPDFAIHGLFSTVGGNSVFEVGLASNGATAVMVQSQELTSGVETDLLVRTIDAAGAVSDMINLTPWAGNQYSPRATWDGTHFIIVYQDQKARTAALSLDQLDARSDLFGMRLDTTGNPVDPQGFVISADPVGETYPNVVAGNGTALFSGSVVANDGINSNYRVFYNLLDTANQWPVAVESVTPGGGDTPLTVDFSSAGSFDPDGVIISYSWDLGDGTSSTAANPSHVYTDAGAFDTSLTVTDDQGATSTQVALVLATAPNQLPIAVGEATPPSGPAPLSVVFDADGSYDPDGFLGNIHWIFSDGGEYWGSPAYHTFTTEGAHWATLEVFDSRGAIGTTTVPVDVGPTNNESPTAAFTFTCTGLACTFADASTDPDGTITAWTWDFGDGFVEFVPNPLPHSYATAGTYDVSLTVRDDIGATDTVTVPVTVTDVAPANSLHIGDLDGSASPVVAQQWTATVNITAHDEFEQPVAGARIIGRWSSGARRTASCVTDATGSCSVSNTRVPGGVPAIAFTVARVRHSVLTHDPDSNHDPDSDSDGTRIIVRQPAPR
jgi:PKD repeat protein